VQHFSFARRCACTDENVKCRKMQPRHCDRERSRVRRLRSRLECHTYFCTKQQFVREKSAFKNKINMHQMLISFRVSDNCFDEDARQSVPSHVAHTYHCRVRNEMCK
jgi:hypothetical protein